MAKFCLNELQYIICILIKTNYVPYLVLTYLYTVGTYNKAHILIRMYIFMTNKKLPIMGLNNKDKDMEDLKIKFDGQTHQIEANTLINSLLHFTAIVQEINAELKTDRKIDIKINALPEGSFLVHFTLEAMTLLEQATKIFSNPTNSAAANIISELGLVYGIYRFLGGKPIKSKKVIGNQVTIENEKGDTIITNNITINIFENKNVQKSLSQEFATLENDPNVTGFEIIDSNNVPIVQIPRIEFSDLAASETNGVVSENENIVYKNGTLNILRLSFDKGQKWDFYYEGNKITAKINDVDFLIKIDSGESFSKGDSLEVELEILQEFDQTVNTFVNKSYKINRIIKHIPRPQQSNLFPPI